MQVKGAIMQISNTAKYGLLAVGYVAKNCKDGLVKVSSLTKECGIPEMYLKKILLLLVNANILESRRGPMGGYSLPRPAQEISMFEIIETLNGPLDRSMEITKYIKHDPLVVKMEKACKDTATKAKDILQKVKISQMI